MIPKMQIKAEQLETCTLLANIIQLSSLAFSAQRKPNIYKSYPLMVKYAIEICDFNYIVIINKKVSQKLHTKYFIDSVCSIFLINVHL